MAENKTKATTASVTSFIAAIADAGQRDDAKALVALMKRVSGEAAKMWGPSIIGFGNRHYKYASGREGDICRIGFSPRKGQMTLYLSCELAKHAPVLARLGKHKTGKGCLYINRLADVEEPVLEELCKIALAERDQVKSSA